MTGVVRPSLLNPAYPIDRNELYALSLLARTDNLKREIANVWTVSPVTPMDQRIALQKFIAFEHIFYAQAKLNMLVTRYFALGHVNLGNIIRDEYLQQRQITPLPLMPWIAPLPAASEPEIEDVPAMACNQITLTQFTLHTSTVTPQVTVTGGQDAPAAAATPQVPLIMRPLIDFDGHLQLVNNDPEEYLRQLMEFFYLNRCKQLSKLLQESTNVKIIVRGTDCTHAFVKGRLIRQEMHTILALGINEELYDKFYTIFHDKIAITRFLGEAFINGLCPNAAEVLKAYFIERKINPLKCKCLEDLQAERSQRDIIRRNNLNVRIKQIAKKNTKSPGFIQETGKKPAAESRQAPAFSSSHDTNDDDPLIRELLDL